MTPSPYNSDSVTLHEAVAQFLDDCPDASHHDVAAVYGIAEIDAAVIMADVTPRSPVEDDDWRPDDAAVAADGGDV